MVNIEKNINRLLTNNLKKCYLHKKEPVKLSDTQLKTLKKFYEYYSNKPSPRGDMNKKTSCFNFLTSLRTFGIFIKKPYEEVTQKDLINFFRYANDKYSSATTAGFRPSPDSSPN